MHWMSLWSPYRALERRLDRPLSLTTHAEHALREFDMAIVPDRHTRQIDGSHCTTACTTIKCNGTRLVQPLVSTVCELHCLAAACKHMKRSCGPWHVVSLCIMRACIPSYSQACLRHEASSVSTKSASSCPCSYLAPAFRRDQVVLAKSRGSNSTSTREAIDFASSTGTGKWVVPVPAATPRQLPSPVRYSCDAERPREPSRHLSLDSRKSLDIHSE